MSIFDPLIMNSLILQVQAGRLLTESHFQAVNTVLGVLPDDSVGCQYVTRMVQSELETVRANGMVATPELAGKLQLTRPYVEDSKRGDDDKSLSKAATRLKRLLGLRDSGRLPPAAQLAAPIGNGAVLDVTETNAIARYLHNILFAPRTPEMPRHFSFGDHHVLSPEDPIFASHLTEYFGDGVTSQMLFNLIQLVPGYVLDSFAIRRDSEGLITVGGVILPQTGPDVAATFYIEIPRRPSEDMKGDGEPPPWVALGKHFQVENIYRHHGLGKALLLQFAAFLRFLQLDGLDAPAQTNGRAFWASQGFEPRGYEALQRQKRKFADFLQASGLYTEEIERQVKAMENLSQIADFRIGDRRVGYEFLADHGGKRILPLRFHLRPNYFGWLRLIPKTYPIEWDELPARVLTSLLNRFELKEETPLEEILLSDQKEGIYLSNWVAHEAHRLERLQMLGQEITEILGGIVEVLNMVHRLKGQHVWHYFMTHMNWPGIADVIRKARERGLDLALEIPERRST